MFERIDPRSPTPIYAQIAERVRVAVAAGELSKGDGLPSVRALATRLRVNPATVVQAYRELEQEKLVEVVRKRRHVSEKEARADVEFFIRHLRTDQNVA